MSICSLLSSSTRHPACTRDFWRTCLSTLCTTPRNSPSPKKTSMSFMRRPFAARTKLELEV